MIQNKTNYATDDGVDPLSLLREMELLADKDAAPLPVEETIETFWRGIGFTVCGVNVVSPMREIDEVLTMPKMSIVPGTQRWVHGLANIRGTLIPIISLQGYLKNTPLNKPSRTSRVVIVSNDEFTSGLMVDGVTGMRQLPIEMLDESIEGCPEFMQPYVHGSIELDGNKHFIFSVKTLSEDEGFSDVSR